MHVVRVHDGIWCHSMGWSDDDDVWSEQLGALAHVLRRGYAHASLSAVAWGKGNVEMLVEEIPIKMARF